jgi:glycosyltransferase involved in cell wall biosynthesis
LRILFINQYYAPDFAATAQLLADLCTGLVARGHEVHVLASRAIYDGRKLDLPAEEVLDGVHVHRIEIGSSRRGRYRERLEGYVSFLSRAFAKVHALPRYDVVVTLTTPPFLSLIGIWLRLVRRSRFVYWVMDIYPDIALRAGVLRTFGPVRLAWSLLGRISYLGANRVVALGDSMRAVLSRKGIADEKLSVVPCWSGGDEVRPVEHEANAFRREHFRPDDFVVMYSGNAGTCHHFRSVIDCIRSLKESPSIKFVFVGGGKRIPQIQTELSGVRNVKFLPLPAARVARGIALCGGRAPCHARTRIRRTDDSEQDLRRDGSQSPAAVCRQRDQRHCEVDPRKRMRRRGRRGRCGSACDHDQGSRGGPRPHLSHGCARGGNTSEQALIAPSSSNSSRDSSNRSQTRRAFGGTAGPRTAWSSHP